LTQASRLTLTLAPPNNVIENGGLEGSLVGWDQDLLGTLNKASFETQNVRSGAYSLRIFDSGGLAQTQTISGMYQPYLSFWYQATGGDGDDTLVAQMSGYTTASSGQTLLLPGSNTITITHSSSDWQFMSVPLILSGTEVYTGTVSIQFQVRQTGPTTTTFYLDEVTLGSIRGGPLKVYLPLVMK
jgi:hypothetical protein